MGVNIMKLKRHLATLWYKPDSRGTIKTMCGVWMGKDGVERLDLGGELSLVTCSICRASGNKLDVKLYKK